MNLLKTGLLNGIAVIVKMLTLLGINKVLAVYVGPAGYAALGQFQNAVQMITTFTSGAITTGVTKYTAEYVGDEIQQRRVWATAGTIAFWGSLSTGLLIAVFSSYLASLFFNDEQFAGVFRWFAATLIFFSFNALLLAILNGRKEIRSFVLASIAGSLFALIVTSVMAINHGIYGALVALAVYQSLSFFITLVICLKLEWFEIQYFFIGFDRTIALKLARYAAMAFTSAACVPLSQLLVRNYLGETLGWDVAGYWEAIWRMSGAYLLFVTSTLSVYYLPRLSELKDVALIRQEIIQGYKVILPAVALVSFLIYLFRDVVINILFSSSFIPMRDLFAWQMIGDTLKIGSWILAYLMLGKAMFRLFIMTEVVFAALFVVLTMLLVPMIGMVGVTVAYALNYAIYWGVMAVFISRELAGQSYV